MRRRRAQREGRCGSRTNREVPGRPARRTTAPENSDAARLVAQEADRSLTACESSQAAAREHKETALAAHIAAETRREAEMHNVASADAEVRAARTRIVDDELERRADAAAASVSDLVATHARAAAAYQAHDPSSLSAALENLEHVQAACLATLQREDRELVVLHAELEVRGEAGLASRLDEARTTLDFATRAVAAYASRAQAAKLLYVTMSSERSEAQRAYVQPLRDKIEPLGRLVFGPTLTVELDDDLRIQSRTLNGCKVDFASLSSGAREQLSVISRLACACLVSPFGGVPLILDDALGYSDPSRLAAMGAVLALAGRTCKVIVLTCTPARYRVGGATVIAVDIQRPPPVSVTA